MENRRLIKLGTIVGGALISALLITFSSVFAYDQNNTHPALTDEIVDFYNLNFPDKKLNSQEKQWLIQGSMEEDTGERPLFHFYDPVYNRGIAHFSSKEWALKPSVQANYYNSQLTGFAAISGGDSANDFSYERALDDYAKGDVERAFVAFGHTLHLLEDAGVPDHTRNDAHPAFIHGQESPYEHEMAKWNPDNFQISRKLFLTREKPVALGNMVEYFDKIANYSNNNFFSRHTINNNNYSQPSTKITKKINVKGAERLFIVKDNLPLAFVAVDSITGSIVDITLVKLEIGSYILDGYWERLSKEIVLNGAGALNLFITEAEEAKRDYASKPSEKPSWFARLFGLIGIGNTSDITTLKVVSQQAVDNSNSGDSMVTPTLMVTNPLVSPLPLVTMTPDTNVTIQTPSVSPSKTPEPLVVKETTPVPATKITSTSSGGSSSVSSVVSPTPTPIPSPSSTPTPTPTPTEIETPIPTPSPTPEVTDKININTANLDELENIPGVGPVIGQRIIDYRNENGQFQKIEDIINVSGIGPKTFEKMKDHITVGNITLKPSAITDLAVSVNGTYFTLTWSAPSDWDTLPASLSYDLRYSANDFTTIDDWDIAYEIASTSLPSVATNGAPESASFNVIGGYGQKWYFAIKTKLTTCSVGNCEESDISNIPDKTTDSALANSWSMLGGNLYHTGYLNTSGVTTDATISWSFEAVGPLSQPVVSDDGEVLFGASDGITSRFYSLDKNGTEKWHYGTNVRSGTPVVLADGAVCFAYGSSVTALNSDGSLRWTHNSPGTGIGPLTLTKDGGVYFTSLGDNKLNALKSDGLSKLQIANPIGNFSTFLPLVLENGNIVIPARVSGTPHFYSYSPSGNEMWDTSFSSGYDYLPSHPSLDLDTGKINSAVGPDFVEINGAGELTKTLIDFNGISSTMVAISPSNFWVGFDFTNHNPASGSQMMALDKSTKEIKWRFRTDSRINNQIAVDKDENVYFSTQNGKLYGLNSGGGLLWVIDAGTGTEISPVLTQNALIWGYGNRLVLVK